MNFRTTSAFCLIIVVAGHQHQFVIIGHPPVLHPQRLHRVTLQFRDRRLVDLVRPDHRINLLADQRRDEIEADIDLLDLGDVAAIGLHHRLQERAIGGDAGNANLLPFQILRARDPRTP